MTVFRTRRSNVRSPVLAASIVAKSSLKTAWLSGAMAASALAKAVDPHRVEWKTKPAGSKEGDAGS